MNNKFKVLLFFPILLFGFDVEFTKIYKEYVVPKKEAILVKTKANNLVFPFNHIKTKNGYILIGDINQIDMWLDNEFYAPDDAKFKTIKIAFIDMDKIQYKVIQKVKLDFKKCNIKKLIFLTTNEERIITKPTLIKIKYKVLLDCK